MKVSRPLNVLASLVAVLALVYAGLGLFWQDAASPFSFSTLRGQTVEIYGRGIYRLDTVIAAAGNRGTDAATLFVALPLLVIALAWYRRGSLRGGLLLTGTLSYFLYNSASLTFGAAWNALVLIYTAAFSASLFAFVLAFTVIDLPTLAARVSPRLHHRGTAAFLIFAGIATALIWLSDIIPAMIQGSAPAVLASYTTVFTYAFDLAVITPATILAGVLLRRRAPLGYLLAPVLLILCLLIGIVVVSQTVFQVNAGVAFNPGQFIGLVSSWVIMGAFAAGLTVSFFRHLDSQGAEAWSAGRKV